MNRNSHLYIFIILTNVVAVLLLSLPVSGQEIVANGDFEDVNICTEIHADCNPSGWFNLNQSGSYGYSNSTRIKSPSGVRHLELVVLRYGDTARNYWETVLLCPLVAGEEYNVSMAIGGKGRGLDLHDIGLYFTDKLFFPWRDTLIQPKDYIGFTDAKVKEGRNGWYNITKTFTAAANASCLIIGNFSPESNADIEASRKQFDVSIEVLVDDLSLTAVHFSACPDAARIKDSLYAIHERHRKPVHAAPAIAPAPLAPHTDTLKIENVSFGFDRSDVGNPDVLDKYKDLLTRPGLKKVLVAGFTDDMGSASYNLELSDRRARAVAALLFTRFGIDPTIVQSEGRGISKDYADKALNRRVEIYLYY
jgi:outer membrane protein OmpA-like peptidoglycan-associated protein